MKEMSSEELMEKAHSLLETIPRKVLGQLSSTIKEVSEQAAQILIAPLQEKNQDDENLLQILPVCLANGGDFEGALSLIATIIANGRYISVNTIMSVYQTTISQLADDELQEDRRLVQRVNSKIQMLIDSTQNITDYQKDITFLVFVGEALENVGNFDQAKTIYQKIIELGSEEGYLRLGLLYKNHQDYDQALKVFQNGWETLYSTICLENIIIALAEQGKNREARFMYEGLLATSSNVADFLFYSVTITSDEELNRLFGLFGSGEEYIPSINAKLYASAGEYVAQKIQTIDDTIKGYLQTGIDTLDDTQKTHLIDSLKKKLYFSYVDILKLRNTRYLASHLVDLNTLAYGSDFQVHILQSFFDEHYDISHLNTSQEDEIDPDLVKMMPDLQKILSAYVQNMLNIHFHGNNYKVIIEQLLPLLEVSVDRQGYADAEDEVDFQEKIEEMKQRAYSEWICLQNMPHEISRLYSELTQKIDTLFGTDIRVFLQYQARYNNEIPKIILKEPNLAAFYFSECLISERELTQESDINSIYDFWNGIIQEYSLDDADTDTAIVFGYCLSEAVALPYGLKFLSLARNVLQSIEGVYLVLNCLQNLEPDHAQLLIEEYDEECLANYNITFLEYIYGFLQEAHQDTTLTASEKQTLLLSLGYYFLLSGEDEKNIQTALDFFQTASDYGNDQALIQRGHIFARNHDYERAQNEYEKALTLSVNMLSLTAIISHNITHGKYHLVDEYIQKGVVKGYHLGSFNFTNLLLQGNTVEAYKQYMYGQSDLGAMFDTQGSFAFFQESLSKSNKIQPYTYHEYREKIFALGVSYFITSNLTLLVDILELFSQVPDFYLGEIFTEFFHAYFPKISCNDPVEMINTFSGHVSYILSENEENAKKEQNGDQVDSLRNLKNDLSLYTIALLSRVSGGEIYIEEWKKGLLLVSHDGLVVNEHISSTLTIQ